MKKKTTYYCQNCGAQFSKWMGRCTVCKEWDTLVEEVVTKSSDVPVWGENKSRKKTATPVRLTDISRLEEQRISTGDRELDWVLGGGLVNGSLVLLGGEPGIGKSTLLLQVAMNMKDTVVYVSGEESLSQIKMRASRLGLDSGAALFMMETNVQNILRQMPDIQPALLVIDSIQTLYSDTLDASPGSVSQIRESTSVLIRYAKETSTPVVIIGHITKEGQIAGPKVLEHMVDVVLQFEGDRNHFYRLLRANKNRFGSTAEIGIYEMNERGLTAVKNPSKALLSDTHEQLSGTAFSVSMEGMRPLIVEVQALVSNAVYGTPQRSTTGYDIKRLHMLLAVLEKRSGFRLGNMDVFLNITGGIKISDPAMDLSVIAAIISSHENTALQPDVCFAAEVGLTGEIRPVLRVERRIAEAKKMGFKKIFISRYHPSIKEDPDITIEKVGNIEHLYARLFV